MTDAMSDPKADPDRPTRQIFDRSVLRIRRNRIAGQSNSADFLDRLVAGELADRLAAVNRDFETAVLSGNARGHLEPALYGTGKTQWRAVADMALGMLAGGAGARLVFDEEALPIAHGACALFVSALTLHYANDLPGALVQIRRALRPDGLFLAALLGGDTLCELRHAMLEAETGLTGGAAPRIAPMADTRDLGGLLQRAGFALPVVDADRLTVRYDTAFHLMRELKAMGLSNVLQARSRTPATRRLLTRAAEIYHATSSDADGRIRATFHVIYLTGWAPHESQQRPLRPGSATRRLADALGTEEHKI